MNQEEGELYGVKLDDGSEYTFRSKGKPTQEAVDAFLAATRPQGKHAAEMINASNQVGAPGHPGVGFGTLFDIGLEAGIPMLAQAVTYPAVETGATSVIGAAASVLGNSLAQIRRMADGEQGKPDWGQTAQAAVTGAIPFVGPEARAAELAAQSSRPLIKAVVDAGKTAVKAGAIGTTGEAVKTLIDDGRLPTLKEAAISSVIPGAIGGVASGVGSAARALITKGRRVADNVADYGAVQPTVGMLLPEEFAATESRMARANPTGPVAKRVDQTYQQLADQVQNVAPYPQEGAKIFESVSPLLGQVSSAQEELSKLSIEAQKATEAAREAAAKVRTVVSASNQQAQQAGVGAAQKLSDQAFDANLGSALDNAKELATAKITGGAAGVDPATARTLFVEHVAKPIEAAFQEKSAQMYSLVDNLSPAFSTDNIMAEANKAAVEITGNLPKKLDSAMDVVHGVLSSPDTSGMVSLQALRNARADLLRRVNMGEFGSTNEERLIKGVAATITKEIDSQAVTALGAEGGEALRAANKFYRETRPLFDKRGVDVLFNPGTPDEVTRTMISGMEKAGIQSDEYKNLQALVSKIGEFNPELKQAAQGHIQDTLRRSIIFDSSRVNPASATGELLVDPAVLTGTLDKMARVPGTLEALNLGTPASVAELKKLMASYPEASKMTTQQWSNLMESPAFAHATAAGQLSTAIEPALAASQAEAQLVKAANMRAGGAIDRAQSAYAHASDTVKKVGGDLTALRDRYEQLLKDPTAIALNNPGIGDSGFNAFANTLFNPAANALTNTDVRAVVKALSSDPNPANRAILTRLQERYIADKIAAYHSTPPTSTMLQHPDSDAVALFFNPTNPSDASNEIARARALLTPQQLNALSAFARTAKSVTTYEKLGGVPVRPGSYDIPVVGEVRRGLDAVADLYREGKYIIAAKLLSDPGKLARIAIKTGENVQTASRNIDVSAQGVGRAIDSRN